MPFPALTIQQSLALGIPIGLAGYAAQEAVLHRRAVKRGAASAPATAESARAEAVGATDVTASTPRTLKAVTTKPATRKAATPKAAAPKAPAPKPAAPKRATDPTVALRRRQASLQGGLEAVIAFVDGPPRRGTATACADALVLAVPKKERGPRIEAYLHAAGAKESPARLQELAEDAGLELAAALKTVTTRLKALSSK